MKNITTLPKFNSIFAHTLFVFLFFCLLYTLFFSSVLFSQHLLAPGDGIIQSVPALYSKRVLWTDLLQGGFPTAADPNNSNMVSSISTVLSNS